ncbi:MAG: hypothetical protein DRH43_10260, partial [Deltaproteobacteria bacterium]
QSPIGWPVRSVCLFFKRAKVLRFVKKRFRPSEKGFGQQAVKKQETAHRASGLKPANHKVKETKQWILQN